ncbi:uncharacterized protein GIQ15_01159 [Arthroderma uncinatum]|uniref:uncharacterized protein n=1 Tax=Arthroderma uncinatum TaxID=74035 RepID=UPI00144ACE94|nr:uncharacterized protein GIQ15_01159 [Arthroderma uncinatum]KAF3491642.1 hypothetical protein GIQ15_01159 [Arthroderma uncinatum]
MTTFGNDAIMVTKNSGVKSINLPSISGSSPSVLKGEVRKLRATDVDPGPWRDMDDDLEVTESGDLLEWLWVNCVKLVLDKLSKDGDVTFQAHEPPRIWWIGTGAASGLPFHAAGDYGGNNPDANTLSLCIPSYVPSIGALRFARKSASRLDKGLGLLEGSRNSVLLVTMPSSPGLGDLDGAMLEAEAIEQVIETVKDDNNQESPTSWSRKLLTCPSSEVVLQNLPHHSIVHFACHGSADHIDPSKSQLIMQTRNPQTGIITADALTMSAISRSIVTRGSSWIAFLSACSTAETKADKFVDEGLHLVSAFQVAGFAHVIGSLWTAADDACVVLARLFYTFLTAQGQSRVVDPNRAVAEALRDAVLQLRRAWLRNPRLWATFIHSGA